MYYGNSNSDESRVIEWINNAAISVNSAEKSELLRKIQEVVLNKSPSLLIRLLSDILSFTTDRDAEARKWLVGFIEEACKRNHTVIATTMPNLHRLLCDESVQVQKRVIQAAKSIFKNMLLWLSKDCQITEAMEQAWNQFNTIKVEILNMVDSDNDGIRTNSVKFLESVVLNQTYPEQGVPRVNNDFSLEDIPLTLKFARRRKLEEEANHIFTLMLKFHGSAHISSVNLMACMGAISRIAKARPEFMPRVVAALESLLTNLPPTLTPSQVSSVKKHMKLQLMNILRHPSAYSLQHTIVATLTELGVGAQEIARAVPKLDEQQRKRYSKRTIEASGPSPTPAKRARVEPEPTADDPDKQKDSAVKINEQFIFDRLNDETVTQIVMSAMHALPAAMPAHFNANYAPVANPGTPVQLRKLARLLAMQFLEAGVGPGCSNLPAAVPAPKMPPSDARVDDEHAKEVKKEAMEIAEEDKTVSKGKEEDAKIVKKPRIKTLRLDQITKPMTMDARQYLLETSVKRILQSEQAALKSGASVLRNKIITTLASTFGPSVRETVLGFILEDLKAHVDIALAWLYDEYSYMQGFSRMINVLRREGKPNQSYNDLLCAILTNLESDEVKDRDLLLSRIILEAPLITEEAVDILKRVCVQESRANATMTLLFDLVSRRPTKAIIFINVLLHHTSHETAVVREEALSRVVELYKGAGGKQYQNIIEEQAIVYLDFLTQTQPPPILFGDDCGRPKIVDNWNDDACKACLYLYMALLPIKETLIHELSRIYTQTTAETKRIILRLLEQPIRGMGMDSPELLQLVESCPKGAETLVTRVIHILTDRGPPSVVLVSKVRELYQTRVSDVRFLIPVLNGLTKKEIIAALPKLIKLNPVVVKEVFNRLLAGHSDGPITPAELLIALHSIDPTKADLKTVMKATSLCFAEKQIYTQEVLAVVMQQLMDVTPLPTLLMRTVIQSLSLYPRLSGFVMNILQRLILKQVWKQKVVWEGFIKCCQRTKPQSYQVLLQLPTAQLAEALSICPELQKPLLEHVKAFTESQRAHLPASVMDVLNGKVASAGGDVTPKLEPSDVLPNEPLPPGMD